MYHLSVKVVQRSKGRSAVAAAAYRSREKILDERQGLTFDYSAKQDLLHKEILGFSGTRSELWNLAELSEKRKDATTAKEYEVALPRELSLKFRIELVREYAKYLHKKHGVAVDFAIHTDQDDNNPHAHILTTTRVVENGNELSALKVARDWSDTKRKKAGLKGRKFELVEAREKWAEITNKFLEMENHAKRVDHRSLKDQGSNLIPGIHIGPTVAAMTQKGIDTDIQKLANEVKELNQEIMISDQLADQILAVHPEPDHDTAETARNYAPEKSKELTAIPLIEIEQPDDYFDYPDPYDHDIDYEGEEMWRLFELESDKLNLAEQIHEQQKIDTQKFVDEQNRLNLEHYHKTILAIKNKSFLTKLGFKLGILKIDDSFKPRKMKISDHKPLKKTGEDLKIARASKENFRKNMTAIETTAEPVISAEPKPIIEQAAKKEYNVVIEAEPQKPTPSVEPATDEEIKELLKAAERQVEEELKQKLKQDNDYDSPSPH